MKVAYGTIHFYKSSEYSKCLDLMCSCGHKVSRHHFNTYTGMSYRSGYITVGSCISACSCKKFTLADSESTGLPNDLPTD